MVATYLAVKEVLRAVRGEEKGVTTVEYSIMLALVALAVALASPNIRDAVVGIFDSTATAVGALNP